MYEDVCGKCLGGEVVRNTSGSGIYLHKLWSGYGLYLHELPAVVQLRMGDLEKKSDFLLRNTWELGVMVLILFQISRDHFSIFAWVARC